MQNMHFHKTDYFLSKTNFIGILYDLWKDGGWHKGIEGVDLGVGWEG